MSQNYRVIIGSYTIPAPHVPFAEGRGIYSLNLDGTTGQLTDLELVAETDNPTYLTLSSDEQQIFCINELAEGKVSSFGFDAETDEFVFLNQVSAMGADPAFISFDPTQKNLLVANYSSGNIAVVPILEKGYLEQATYSEAFSNSGPSERQAEPHAHQIKPFGDFVYAVNLGGDEILTLKQTGQFLILVGSSALPKGSGPRHLAFDLQGNFAYVVLELTSEIAVMSLDKDSGLLALQQVHSTLPRDVSTENTPAEIVLSADGRFVYVSNRGHDSIVQFVIDPKSGKVRAIEDFLVWGEAPRAFAITPDGNWLLSANQNSSDITVFKINPEMGQLEFVYKEFCPTPVCVIFAEQVERIEYEVSTDELVDEFSDSN